MSDQVIRDQEGLPLTVWRGESSGNLFEQFELRKTQAQSGFFFAEEKSQADSYAKAGTEARSFHLRARRVLDLTDPYTPQNIQFIRAYSKEFDEWIDRVSGEEMDASSFLEGGYLYDYEGNGSGERWHALFRFANGEGFDAVRVMDATDGCTAPVWVVFEPAQITPATAEVRFSSPARYPTRSSLR